MLSQAGKTCVLKKVPQQQKDHTYQQAEKLNGHVTEQKGNYFFHFFFILKELPQSQYSESENTLTNLGILKCNRFINF